MQLKPQTTSQQQQNIQLNPNKNIISQPCHKMITISKSRIFKLKLYTIILTNTEPNTIQKALNDQNWHQAIRDEYEALIRKKNGL